VLRLKKKDPLDHGSICAQISAKFQTKVPDEQHGQRTSDDLAIDQGRAISSGIGPKRSRAKRNFLEYPVEAAGSDAAVSRDHEAERQRREENKRCREQDEREVDALRTEHDFLAGAVEELDSTIRDFFAIVPEQLGTIEAHPALRVVGTEFPDISTIFEELEASELSRASEQLVQRLGDETAALSYLAHLRGLVMSKQEHAAYHSSEINRGIERQEALQIEVDGRRATCLRLIDEPQSRNLIIRSLKSTMWKLKEQVSNARHLL
jgi:hypothetical protein